VDHLLSLLFGYANLSFDTIGTGVDDAHSCTVRCSEASSLGTGVDEAHSCTRRCSGASAEPHSVDILQWRSAKVELHSIDMQWSSAKECALPLVQ